MTPGKRRYLIALVAGKVCARCESAPADDGCGSKFDEPQCHPCYERHLLGYRLKDKIEKPYRWTSPWLRKLHRIERRYEHGMAWSLGFLGILQLPWSKDISEGVIDLIAAGKPLADFMKLQGREALDYIKLADQRLGEILS